MHSPFKEDWDEAPTDHKMKRTVMEISCDHYFLVDRSFIGEHCVCGGITFVTAS